MPFKYWPVTRPGSAAAAQRYRQSMCSSYQRCTAAVTLRDLLTLSRTKRRPAAATQALSSGEVPTAVGCCTARIACYTKRDRRLREQESSPVLLQFAGRRMVTMACKKTGLLSFSVRPSIVFGTHAVESYISTSRWYFLVFSP